MRFCQSQLFSGLWLESFYRLGLQRRRQRAPAKAKGSFAARNEKSPAVTTGRQGELMRYAKGFQGLVQPLVADIETVAVL